MERLVATSVYFSQNLPIHERSNKRLNDSLEPDEQEPGPSKRTRIGDQAKSPPKQTPCLTSQYFSARTPDEDAARKQRLEAKKRMLLADNNPFLKRQNSVQLDRDSSPIVIDDGDDDSGEESDPDLSSLIAFFTSEQQKPKRTMSKRKQKPKEQELFTAGELQAIQLQKQHPGVLLMFEIGYKCLFFGDDAQIASRDLGIKYSTERKLPSAMIPMQRREVYLKKLLSRGYKVGLVEQMETRALKKAGGNRNTPFKRAVNQIYTAATYVDELGSADNDIAPTLMCVIEGKKGGRGTNEKVTIGLIVVCPTTGEVVWDHFEDTRMRTELETRMVHTRPYELLLPESGISRETSKLLNFFVDHTNTENKIRIENCGDTLSYSQAFSYISEFYSKSDSTMDRTNIIAIVADLPKVVAIALSHTIRYLSAFAVSRVFRQAIHFLEFKNKMHMLLNANTITNLEIYRNESDFTKKGSLLWILDQTRTRFGSRRLRSWLGKPLANISAVQERLDAVEEMSPMHKMNEVTKKLGDLLKGLPDLEKGLCRMQYGQCTPTELCDILDAFHRVAHTFAEYTTHEDVGCSSKLLKEIIFALPRLQQPIKSIVSQMKMGAARIGEKHRMWEPTCKYHGEVEECDESVQFVEWELQQELKKIREYIGDPELEFVDVGFEEYLVQLLSSKINDGSITIPDKWIPFSSTKYYKRYRTDEVTRLMEDRAQHKERLEAAASKAYHSFLEDITTQYYGLLRDAVNKLAVADCLRSLAIVAGNMNYVRPRFTEDDVVDIRKGRHPIVEVLRSDPFIPNDICLGGDGGDRCKIITGPNMGGKSSATRMVAIIAVMAQLGSFVPADSLTMGMLDGIMTRMGASDELARGRSTFMVEMTETSEILHTSTSKSLVILDELGRGTSTFDGMAIANAVVRHLVQKVKCKTLFVTHYPIIASELERRFPGQVQNLHMGYNEETRIDGSRDITFLYRLTRGVTTESFGVECGRLAGLPESILQVAANKARDLRSVVESRARKKKLLDCAKLLQDCIRTGDKPMLDELNAAIGAISTN